MHRLSVANSQFCLLLVRGSMGKYYSLEKLKFGKLTVLYRTSDYISPKSQKPRAVWHCICDCGNVCDVLGENLRRGNTKSCGCEQRETASKQLKTHGYSKERLYGVWLSMKSRCFNESDAGYKLYGGRGIKVCNEWLDYEVFRSWAYNNGYNPLGKRGETTIDRINCDGNYCPTNCRWITQEEQMNNVRYNRRLTLDGETHTAAEWGKITGVRAGTILQRIDRDGYTVEQALTKRK